MRYEIKNFKSFRKNTLRGFFSLRIDHFEIESFTYHEKDGKRWVGMPSKQSKDENGELAWFPTVRINDKEKYASFQQWAIAEVKALLPKTPVQAPLQPDDDIPF